MFHAEPGTPEAAELRRLSELIGKYEDEHFQFDVPDPVNVIEFEMERLGYTRNDLIQFIGDRRTVERVMSRQQPLTSHMIESLAKAFAIPESDLERPTRVVGATTIVDKTR